MRRKDREITDFNAIIEIMKKCDVCSVAFFDEEFPYIVPLNFGIHYDGEVLSLFFHGANAGKKLELMKKNNKVAFEMNCAHKLIDGEMACDVTMEFESVCGNGIIEKLEGPQKQDALIHLMNQYVNKDKHEFNEKAVNAVTVLKLTVHEIHGKALKCS